LRFHRHHRRLPRAAASGGRGVCRPRHRPHRRRWRYRPDDDRLAERRSRYLSGDDAVPAAGERYPRTLSLPPRRRCSCGGGGMSTDIVIAIIITLVGASTPILLAALGELVVEKSGVLNLGV